MRYSVVIPTHNYAHLLPFALESVLAQEGDDYEIIVIDDGSTDNTQAVVARYTATDKPVRYTRQENAGPAAARNRGQCEARGDYVLFLDADDRLLPGALKCFDQAISQHPVEFICGGHISVKPDGKTKVHNREPFSECQEDNFIGFLRKRFGSIVHGAVIIKREVFQDLEYPDTLSNNEDLVLFAQILARHKVASFPEPVVEIFSHTDSLRHDVGRRMQTADKVVDLLFDPVKIPQPLILYRREFASRHRLSLFRSFYLAGKYPQARRMYHQAIKIFPPNLFIMSYLSKYMRSLFR